MGLFTHEVVTITEPRLSGKSTLARMTLDLVFTVALNHLIMSILSIILVSDSGVSGVALLPDSQRVACHGRKWW